MTPMILGLGWPELVIILVVVLLLFGGTRLAGLGKSTGRALKEFKEETKGLRDKPEETAAGGEAQGPATTPDAEPRPGTTEHQAPVQEPYQAPHQAPHQAPTQPTAADPRRDS